MSQHSTTSTETHNLVKYSRSYGLGADSNEWQHFVNPVLKALLDAKKSPMGELTSVRLRILWLMNTGNDTMDVDKREVVFEDMELLSFSSLLSNHTQPIRNAQGLPLKAVYRDSVVGIRYLHPMSAQPNSSPIYRRFQITFDSGSAASQFIDAIRHVCPCKLHEPPSLGRTSTMVPFSAQVQHRNTQQPVSRAQARISSKAHTPDLPASTYLPAMHISPGAVSSSSFQSPRMSTPLNMSNSLSPSLSDNNNRTHIHAPTLPTSGGTGSKSSVNNELRNSSSLGHQNSTDLSLPSSSQPSSNSGSSTMPPPPLPSHVRQPAATISTSVSAALPAESDHVILRSLRETSALYNLSRADLESLVSHVVGEDGFAELLENMDSMWRVKGFLER